jgi:phosphoesterase RecJ-like protein
VLNSLELCLDKRVAVQTMRRDLLEESSARYEEADQLINIPLRSDDIRVSVFFKENHDGVRRCSLRSKGEVDVAAIAQSFGGGGHKTAAGFKCIRSFEVMKEEVLEKIRSSFNGSDP